MKGKQNVTCCLPGLMEKLRMACKRVGMTMMVGWYMLYTDRVDRSNQSPRAWTRGPIGTPWAEQKFPEHYPCPLIPFVFFTKSRNAAFRKVSCMHAFKVASVTCWTLSGRHPMSPIVKLLAGLDVAPVSLNMSSSIFPWTEGATSHWNCPCSRLDSFSPPQFSTFTEFPPPQKKRTTSHKQTKFYTHEFGLQ